MCISEVSSPLFNHEYSVADNLGPEITEAFISFKNLHGQAADNGSKLSEFYRLITYKYNGSLGEVQHRANNGLTVDSFEGFNTKFPTASRNGEMLPKNTPIMLNEKNKSKVKTEVRTLLEEFFAAGVRVDTRLIDRTVSPADLQNIDEYKLEHLVSKVWEDMGWSTEVTSGATDRGIDVIATKNNHITQKHLIQVKRYSSGNKISSDQIRKYGTLKTQESRVDVVIVLTTSSFTDPAAELAKDLNVKTMNAEEFITLLLQ